MWIIYSLMERMYVCILGLWLYTDWLNTTVHFTIKIGFMGSEREAEEKLNRIWTKRTNKIRMGVYLGIQFTVFI